MAITDQTEHVAELTAQVDDLSAELAALRDDLNALRTSLATEVVTRRLSVVDDQGVERVYTSVGDASSLLYVTWPIPSEGEPVEHAEITLFAGAGASQADRAEAIVNASTGDNQYALRTQRTHSDGSGHSALDLMVGDHEASTQIGGAS